MHTWRRRPGVTAALVALGASLSKRFAKEKRGDRVGVDGVIRVARRPDGRRIWFIEGEKVCEERSAG
jgi:hypothetical protein